MAGTGYKIAGTVATISSPAVGWSDPTNAQSFNDSNATVVLTGSETSEVLRCTNFDFASLASTDTVIGVSVRVFAGLTAGTDGDITFNSVQLVLDGSTQGDDLDAAEVLNNAFVWFRFGGFSTLWGATPSIANVQDTGWGVNITCVNVDAGTAGVRMVTMAIHTANTRNRRHIGARGRVR